MDDQNSTDDQSHRHGEELQSLLNEAAASESREHVDTDSFVRDLRDKIETSRSKSRRLQFAIAAAIVFALVMRLSIFAPDPAPERLNPVVSNSPDMDLLQSLDLLEMLADLDPELIAALDPADIDAVDGFDLALAELPLELLITEDGEE